MRIAIFREIFQKTRYWINQVINRDDNIQKILIQKNQISSRRHFQKILVKGKPVYYEIGFKVYNGHHNIFLGSNIYLVDAVINAGDGIGSVTIGDYVVFGHRVLLLARGHNYSLFGENRVHSVIEKPIKIEEGVWIGSHAIILGGVTIGRHSVVGAGSVVTRDVPDYTVVCGNPAVIIKQIVHNNT